MIPAFIKSLQYAKDDNDKHLTQAFYQVFELYGRYIDPAVYLHYLLPRLQGDISVVRYGTDNATKIIILEILFYMLQGSRISYIVPHFEALIKVVVDDYVIEPLSPGLVEASVNIIAYLLQMMRGKASATIEAHFMTTGRLVTLQQCEYLLFQFLLGHLYTSSTAQISSSAVTVPANPAISSASHHHSHVNMNKTHSHDKKVSDCVYISTKVSECIIYLSEFRSVTQHSSMSQQIEKLYLTHCTALFNYILNEYDLSELFTTATATTSTITTATTTTTVSVEYIPHKLLVALFHSPWFYNMMIHAHTASTNTNNSTTTATSLYIQILQFIVTLIEELLYGSNSNSNISSSSNTNNNTNNMTSTSVFTSVAITSSSAATETSTADETTTATLSSSSSVIVLSLLRDYNCFLLKMINLFSFQSFESSFVTSTQSAHSATATATATTAVTKNILVTGSTGSNTTDLTRQHVYFGITRKDDIYFKMCEIINKMTKVPTDATSTTSSTSTSYFKMVDSDMTPFKTPAILSSSTDISVILMNIITNIFSQQSLWYMLFNESCQLDALSLKMLSTLLGVNILTTQTTTTDDDDDDDDVIVQHSDYFISKHKHMISPCLLTRAQLLQITPLSTNNNTTANTNNSNVTSTKTANMSAQLTEQFMIQFLTSLLLHLGKPHRHASTRKLILQLIHGFISSQYNNNNNNNSNTTNNNAIRFNSSNNNTKDVMTCTRQEWWHDGLLAVIDCVCDVQEEVRYQALRTLTVSVSASLIPTPSSAVDDTTTSISTTAAVTTTTAVPTTTTTMLCVYDRILYTLFQEITPAIINITTTTAAIDTNADTSDNGEMTSDYLTMLDYSLRIISTVNINYFQKKLKEWHKQGNKKSFDTMSEIEKKVSEFMSNLLSHCDLMQALNK